MDKEALFVDRLPTDDVDVVGIGTFQVRGLSRYEVMLLRKTADDGVAAFERKMIAMGVLGPFTLTEAEVERWQKAATAGEVAAVSDRIAELSGLAESADKEAYKSVPVESGA